MFVLIEKMFKTVFELQPRESGDGGGQATTREEKVKTIVDDILEKMPDQFNMQEIIQKCEERTPYVIVCFQECDRMNLLTNEMKRSLKELDLGLKGELTLTSEMEDLSNSLFFDQVSLKHLKIICILKCILRNVDIQSYYRVGTNTNKLTP